MFAIFQLIKEVKLRIRITRMDTNRGPIIPIKIPPNLKSFCCKKPVLNAIALGGVEMGKNKALEALRPMINVPPKHSLGRLP